RLVCRIAGDTDAGHFCYSYRGQSTAEQAQSGTDAYHHCDCAVWNVASLHGARFVDRIYSLTNRILAIHSSRNGHLLIVGRTNQAKTDATPADLIAQSLPGWLFT